MKLQFTDPAGKKQDVIMGCYGIGPSRVLGTVIEIHHDEQGIIWPESIAPFKVHLLVLGEDENLFASALQLYEDLSDKGIEVLYDDRHGATAGEKFADSDLIGIPYRVVVSKRSTADGGYEVKKRTEDGGKIVNKEELFNLLESTI